MDTLFRPQGLNALDKEIERLTNQLSNMSPVDQDYKPIVENIKTLCEAREKKNDRVLSKEVLFTAGVNILTVLLVLNFEKTGIVTSKAFSFLTKGKS